MGRLRQRGLAWFLARGMDRYERLVAPHKQELFDGVNGRVVEVGAGTGPNMRYLRGCASYLAIEPNPFLRKHLQESLSRHGIEGDIAGETAERTFDRISGDSVDYVVCTLVLCSVPEPAQLLDSIHRVLRPGGRLLLLEHVGAAKGTAMCCLQHLASPAFRVFGDGCRPERDTLKLLRSSRFTTDAIENFRLPLGPVSPHIAGWLGK